jgi:hypothetical protein
MGELGISMGPKIVDPDFELSRIITEINKNSSSYSDADAFVRGTEPTDAIAELTSLQRNSQGYYAASAALKGQLINFDSNRSKVLVDSKGKTVAKLPKTKGVVTMGFHLPVSNVLTGRPTTSKVVNITDPHSQIPQLPSRFRFPLFTNRADTNGDYRLENFSFQYDSIDGYSRVRRGFDIAEDVLDTTATTGEFVLPGSMPFAVGKWAFRKLFSNDNEISSETNQDVYDDYIQSVISVYGDLFAESLIPDNDNIIERKLSTDQIADVTQNSYNFNMPIDPTHFGGESVLISMPLPRSRRKKTTVRLSTNMKRPEKENYRVKIRKLEFLIRNWKPKFTSH